MHYSITGEGGSSILTCLTEQQAFVYGRDHHPHAAQEHERALSRLGLGAQARECISRGLIDQAMPKVQRRHQLGPLEFLNALVKACTEDLSGQVLPRKVCGLPRWTFWGSILASSGTM
jgi:hypothetical protein